MTTSRAGRRLIAPLSVEESAKSGETMETAPPEPMLAWKTEPWISTSGR